MKKKKKKSHLACLYEMRNWVLVPCFVFHFGKWALMEAQETWEKHGK